MRLELNCEKHHTLDGTYKIWDGSGRLWLARRDMPRPDEWRATPAPSNSARAIIGASHRAHSLSELSRKLAEVRERVASTEPFF
jgi:hypothetical protein